MFITNKCVVTVIKLLFDISLRVTYQYRLLATYKLNRQQTTATVSAAAFSVLQNMKMEIYKNDGLLTYIIINFVR